MVSRRLLGHSRWIKQRIKGPKVVIHPKLELFVNEYEPPKLFHIYFYNYPKGFLEMDNSIKVSGNFFFGCLILVGKSDRLRLGVERLQIFLKSTFML